MDEIDLCRVCANFTSSNSSTNLFDRKQRQLLTQIKDITGCALKNAKDYPKCICEYCEESLKQAILFRKRCQDSQQYFNSDKYKELVQEKADEEFTENEAHEVVTVYLAEPGGDEEECDDFANEQEKDTKENIKTILFESDDNVINTFLKDGALASKENSLKTEDGVDSESSNDDVALSKIIKKENLKDSSPSETKRKNKTKEKQTKKLHKSKLPQKINQKIKKEKIVDFMCDQCGNHFTCRHHFVTHLRRHANDKRYQCELCPAKFFTHSELKRHMRRHTGERPFECKHCKRRFTDFSTRVKHERIHTNERPFKCDQCDKAFTTSYVLKNHMLIHTGERSFKCQICNKSFQRQVHLDVHYRSISHKQMEEKEFSKTE